jgi:hypothetical protein
MLREVPFVYALSPHFAVFRAVALGNRQPPTSRLLFCIILVNGQSYLVLRSESCVLIYLRYSDPRSSNNIHKVSESK